MYTYKTKFLFDNKLNNVYFYDVFMNGDDYVVQFVVPGFSENELELSIKENVLFLEGKKEKSISKLLPKSIYGEILIKDNLEIVDAILENGVLTVTMRRKTQRGAKIPIKTVSSKIQEKSQVLIEENNQETNIM
jgi:HSP20 family molecular chaperone IbpA